MTTTQQTAREPKDLTRLFTERANAGDIDGLAALYADDAVLAFPAGRQTVGREAIRDVFEEMLRHVDAFASEEQLPTLRHGDLALTATRSADETGVRVQVAQRQGDGSWLRIIDRPEAPS
jgi:ketosteroid isomerase-like protein